MREGTLTLSRDLPQEEDEHRRLPQEECRYTAALKLIEEKSLKEATGKRYRTKVKEAAARIGHQPPFNEREVIVLLKSLHEEAVGKTTADQYRLATSWWHRISGHHDPCDKQAARLCDAMKRDLPNKGNPARRPFTAIETEAIIRLCQTIKEHNSRRRVGPLWHPVRNGPQHGIEN
jgi:hypothetical protein